MKTTTTTIINALRQIPYDVVDDEGVVSACLYEAAERLEQLERDSELLQKILERGLIKCWLLDEEFEIHDMNQLIDLMED